MAKLRVTRKAHKRKAYRREDGVRVDGSYVDKSTFLIKDRGKKGRGQKILPTPKRKGILGEGFFSKPVSTQKGILKKVGNKYGERTPQGQMQWIATMQKRTNPKVSKRAKYLRDWVATEFD